MSEWVVRDGVREDEPCVVPMWIKALVRGGDARGARGRGAAPSWSSDEFVAFYATMQPIVEGLLRSGATVRVACDPERAHYSPGRLAVIHAWSVTAGDVVYGVGIRKDSARAGFRDELARAVLGDMLDRPMRMALDIVDIVPPQSWRKDRGWAAAIRYVSERRIIEDAVFGAVLAHVVDPTRVPWRPREAA